MKIMRVIERADALCPNPYTLEEKLDWCDEVTAELRRSILKTYDVIETETGSDGVLQLPDDIPFENVEVVYCGNQMMSKQDFRSFIKGCRDGGYFFSPHKKLRVVYLTMPERIRNIEIRGKFNTGDNTIEMEMTPFAEGDMIEIATLSELSDKANWDNAETAYVTEAHIDKIILDRDAAPAQTEAKLAIRRIIDDVTAIDEAPYDSMYIEYLLAKAALYQHDYVGYDAHMTQYNCLYDSMRREMRTRSPLNEQVRFKNYSIV